MLPSEFKIGTYRYSFRRHTPDMLNHIYVGKRLIGGEYISIGELAVRPSTTKPALHRMFQEIEKQGC